MTKKPKATENKAKDVETQKVEKLWAQYGKLQAQRELQTIALRQTGQQLNQKYQQIRELEGNPDASRKRTE